MPEAQITNQTNSPDEWEEDTKAWYLIQYGILVRAQWAKVDDPEWRTKLIKEIAQEDELVPSEDKILLTPWNLESLANAAAVSRITDGVILDTEAAHRFEESEYKKLKDSAWNRESDT